MLTQEDMADNSFKHPPSQREGTARTYANAYHVYTYGAIVAFMRKLHRKPKGEELHKLLHASWKKYHDDTEYMGQVSARATAPPPPSPPVSSHYHRGLQTISTGDVSTGDSMRIHILSQIG